ASNSKLQQVSAPSALASSLMERVCSCICRASHAARTMASLAGKPACITTWRPALNTLAARVSGTKISSRGPAEEEEEDDGEDSSGTARIWSARAWPMGVSAISSVWVSCVRVGAWT
ncbi:hypothetical protein Vretimale_4817, partial [Volvox reticuliferus]